MFDDTVRTGAGHKFRCRRDIVSRLVVGQTGSSLECATGTGEITAAVLGAGEFQSKVINDYSVEMLQRSKSLVKRTTKLV